MLYNNSCSLNLLMEILEHICPQLLLYLISLFTDISRVKTPVKTRILEWSRPAQGLVSGAVQEGGYLTELKFKLIECHNLCTPFSPHLCAVLLHSRA